MGISVKKIFEGRTRVFRLSALHIPATPFRVILPLCFSELHYYNGRMCAVTRQKIRLFDQLNLLVLVKTLIIRQKSWSKCLIFCKYTTNFSICKDFEIKFALFRF